MLETTKWDTAEYINTKEDVIALLNVSLEENDLDFLCKMVGHILRSEGINEIASELGQTREELCNSLAPNGDVSFNTVFKLLDILGFRLKMEQKSA